MADADRLRKRITRMEDRYDDEDDPAERRRIQRNIDKLEDQLDVALAEEKAAAASASGGGDDDGEAFELTEEEREAIVARRAELEAEAAAAKAGDSKPGSATGSKAGDRWFGDRKPKEGSG